MLAEGGPHLLAQLTEADDTANWFLALFSPTLLLALLTIVLIVTGFMVWAGRITPKTFGGILGGCISIFGARSALRNFRRRSFRVALLSVRKYSSQLW